MTTSTYSSESSAETATLDDAPPLATVLEHCLPRLRRFVHHRMNPQLRAREDTQDIVQSTVRELLRRPEFEWRGALELRAWLFQAAQNKVLEKQRFHGAGKRAQDRQATQDSDDRGSVADCPADGASPSRIAIGRDDVTRLQAALAQLTEPQRQVLMLARVMGLPHAEIAARLGKSEVAVRQLLVRGVTALGAVFRTC